MQVAYRDHLVDVDADVAEQWGRFNVPDPLPVINGLLAASAKVRGWTLVTRHLQANRATTDRQSVSHMCMPPPR